MTTSSRSRWGIAPRLLAAMSAVVVVSAITAWIVATLIGPGIFHDHLAQGGNQSPAVILHAEMAFQSASGTALGWALVAALLASAVITWLVARPMSQALAAVTQAAELVAGGDHRLAVPHAGLGHEFDQMVDAFNQMATELDGIEQTRTQILADLAHEMRTPLATLDAYLEAISDGVEELDSATVTLLQDQTLRLTRLAQDIALVTAAEEGRLDLDPARVEVAALLQSAVLQAKSRYEKSDRNLVLDIDPLGVGEALFVDRDRLGQVLTNLLDNAFRHVHEGGTVIVTAKREGHGIRIQVVDDGDGIAQEHLPRIFDRFYRVDAARDRRHGGSGVGLAIAKAIITKHDGTMSAQSPGPGLGTTISIWLPLEGPKEN